MRSPRCCTYAPAWPCWVNSSSYSRKLWRPAVVVGHFAPHSFQSCLAPDLDEAVGQDALSPYGKASQLPRVTTSPVV